MCWPDAGQPLFAVAMMAFAGSNAGRWHLSSSQALCAPATFEPFPFITTAKCPDEHCLQDCRPSSSEYALVAVQAVQASLEREEDDFVALKKPIWHFTQVGCLNDVPGTAV